jgi:hypothetical protein
MGKKSNFILGTVQMTRTIRTELSIFYHTSLTPSSFNWSPTYKWILTITICFVSILTGLPAGSYGAGNSYMASLFNVQNEPFPNLYWATCSWNMGAALFPLIFVPLTENAGRMPGYFVGDERSRPSSSNNYDRYRISSSSFFSSAQRLPTISRHSS